MKKISRRKFLQISGLAAGASILPMPVKWLGRSKAEAYYQSKNIPLFQTDLRNIFPGPASGFIPVANSDGTVQRTGARHYTLTLKQYQDQILPTGVGYGTTKLWGYVPDKPLLGPSTATPRHLGGIIVGEKNQPIQITLKNRLPTSGKHIIPVDTTILDPIGLGFSGYGGNFATAVHLHGGLVPWISDGGPFDWFNSSGVYGPSFQNDWLLDQPVTSGTTPGKKQFASGDYFYPLNQSARLVWYHDHAWGITRINAYAGIASALIIRDNYERGLVSTYNLPNFIELGGPEIPLVFQDKIFVGSNINLADPSWSTVSSATTPGSLWYPHIYERGRWRRVYSNKAMPAASIIPEMFGDTILVNGTAYPQVTIPSGRYRFRVLNAFNARFANLQLYEASPSDLNGVVLDGTAAGLISPATTAFVDGDVGLMRILQIGTEGGFLPKAVTVSVDQRNTTDPPLLLAPAERADIVINFPDPGVGNTKSYILYSDAPAPFPGGSPNNDYFPGLPNGNQINAVTQPGKGPNSRVMMKFTVTHGAAPGAFGITPGFDFTAVSPLNSEVWNDPLLVDAAGSFTTPAVGDTLLTGDTVAVVRQLSLNETFDSYGRLEQRLGTLAASPAGTPYLGAATETIQNGTVEVWEIYNVSADTHPIHIHLANAQIINREPFQGVAPSLTPAGNPTLPAANETGWKETIRMNPGEITRLIMKFDMPQVPIYDPNTQTYTLQRPPTSTRPGAAGYHEYVWHCHILEHEEHDMMRPLLVTV